MLAWGKRDIWRLIALNQFIKKQGQGTGGDKCKLIAVIGSVFFF